MSISPLRRARPRTAALAVAGLAVALIVGAAVLAILPTPARAATATVPMGGSIYGPFWFCDSAHSGVVCTTTVSLGDTVTWQNTTLVYHTVTECDGNCGVPNPPGPLWDSGLIAPSASFSRQFNSLGTFNYQCNVHPTEMKGQIVVVAAGPTATFTLSPTPTPTPTPPPAVGGVSLDPSGGAPSGGSWPVIGFVAGALGLLSALWVTRRRLLR